jgi:hypothetical protein
MSGMSTIAVRLSNCLDNASDEDLEALHQAMSEYPRSIDGLRRVPGFRMLWDAIRDAADFHHEMAGC